jgi:hypothetical protein
MFYNIDVVKNGISVRKCPDKNAYEEDTYVFLNMEDALAWIKQDSGSKT